MVMRQAAGVPRGACLSDVVMITPTGLKRVSFQMLWRNKLRKRLRFTNDLGVIFPSIDCVRKDRSIADAEVPIRFSSLALWASPFGLALG
jgi:hypothetical protein